MKRCVYSVKSGDLNSVLICRMVPGVEKFVFDVSARTVMVRGTFDPKTFPQDAKRATKGVVVLELVSELEEE